MEEGEIRTVSARLYSELLRIACASGWTFTRNQVAAGFRRHFEESRSTLAERGVTVVPLGYVPRLVVTELFTGFVEPFPKPERRSCYRARWQLRPDPRIAPKISPVSTAAP